MSDFWDALPEQPSEQREEMILAAVEEGHFDPITWSSVGVGLDEGVELLLSVASDSLKIDGERVNVNMTTMQKIVDVLGYAFPTSKLSDLIYEHADVVIGACTQTPDSKMAYTTRTLKHSAAVDAKINGRQGLRSTVGKDWVLSNRLVGHPDKSANYGWHDPSAAYTSPGGIKLWQTLGLAHDRWHVDYSQVVRLINRNCMLNGEQMDLMQLLTTDEFAHLLSYEGKLQLNRMPGVPLYVPATTTPPVAGDTLGERCVEWCLKHVGEKEQPPGSNDSPFIRQCLAPCARGYGDKRIVLGISKMNWCAAFQCAAMQACLRPGDLKPHDYRAGVVELVEDTYPGNDGLMPFAGRYIPVEQARSGKFAPSIGDLAIYDRSTPGKPETSWFRHVNRVISYHDAEGIFQTVGGNEGQQVSVGEQHIGHAKLLGFIHYPQPEQPAPEAPVFTEHERQQIQNMVGMFLREAADNIWRESHGMG
jgi:hypothetical protein